MLRFFQFSKSLMNKLLHQNFWGGVLLLNRAKWLSSFDQDSYHLSNEVSRLKTKQQVYLVQYHVTSL